MASLKTKPLRNQTIVITGASSGIGLCTARMAAKAGANVVLTARNAEVLREEVERITSAGGQAVHVVADVGDEGGMERVAEAARRAFGGFDTWVNNAGVTVFGPIEEISIADHRRLFETNFWGTVYGSRIASRHLRTHGGVLINIGSAVSERAIPLQGMYSASKHAVKAFTDALRMELEHDNAPVAVVLIKPTSIATQYTEHGKNYMPNEPRLPPPVYAPETVARAILHCAVHPRRDAFVGSPARTFAWMDYHAPRLTDRLMERTLWSGQQQPGKPDRGRPDSLHSHAEDGRERGGPFKMVRQRSFYTDAQLHPLRTAATALGVTAAIVTGAWAGARWLTR